MAFFQDGLVWDYYNATAETIWSDTIIEIGNAVGLTVSRILPGKVGAVRMIGAIEGDKPIGETWTQNDELNWDATNQRFTTAVASLANVAVASSPADANSPKGQAFIFPKMFAKGVVAYTVVATDDAGDGTVEGDINATDFTAQFGSTYWEPGVADIPTVLHKTVAYTYVGPRDVRIGLGGNYVALNADFSPIGTADHNLLQNRTIPDQHSQSAITGLVADQAIQDGRIASTESKNAEQDGRLDTIDSEQVVQDGRLDTIDSEQVVQDGRLDTIDSQQVVQDGRLDTIDSQQVVQDGRLDVLESERTRWRGPWVQGQTYLQNDMAIQHGWLGIVTAASTTDGPEPVATGVEDWLIDLNGTWAPTQQTISEEAYFTGNEYEFAQGLYVLGYRIWLPNNSQNFQFQLWAALNLGSPNEQLQQIAVVPNGVATGQWLEVGVGVLRIPPGTTLTMLKLTLASTLSETFTANWDVKNTGGTPSEGEANFQGNETEIRVHKTDKDDIDQTDNLEAVEVGGTLSFGGSTWTIIEVDIRASHVRYHLDPAQGRPEENTYALTFTWGSVEDIPYVTDADYWAPVGPVRGCQGANLRTLDYDNDAHGVDVYVQQVVVSDDWDIMSAPVL